MADEKRITVPASVSFHRRVKTRAAREGLQLSVVVRALLSAWVSGDIKIDSSGVVSVPPAQEQSKAA